MKANSLIAACVIAAATLGSVVAPAQAAPMDRHMHHVMMRHRMHHMMHRMMVRHEVHRMMRHRAMHRMMRHDM